MSDHRWLVTVVCMLVCVLSMTARGETAAGPSGDRLPADAKERLARTAWMPKARWGIAIHYMREFLQRAHGLKNLTPERWKARVKAFRVEALADQLQSVGAGYVVIGLSQCGGYLLAPNAEYDRAVGRDAKTTWFPQRDVVGELAAALKKRGVATIVYLPIEPPVRGDPLAVRVLRPIGQKHPKDGHVISSDEGWRHFSGAWEPIVREYAKRWGPLLAGWWFDGGWFGQLSYKDAPNWDSFLAAARAGNPSAAVAINHQYRNLRGLPLPREDYFAGETNQPHRMFVASEFRHGVVRNQVLTYLGKTWGTGTKPRFTKQQMAQIADNVLTGGGVLTWDVPFRLDGTLAPTFLDHLKAFNQAARQSPMDQWRKRTGGKTVPEGNLAYRKRALLCSRGAVGTGGLHTQFTRLLPANSYKHYAAGGVDGDPDTMAMGSKEWSWAYLVDLLQPETVGRIVVHFHEKSFATHYQVRISRDGARWETVKEDPKANGGRVTVTFAPKAVRYIRVEAIKPDGANQKGYQMAITELQAFAK